MIEQHTNPKHQRGTMRLRPVTCAAVGAVLGGPLGFLVGTTVAATLWAGRPIAMGIVSIPAGMVICGLVGLALALSVHAGATGEPRLKKQRPLEILLVTFMTVLGAGSGGPLVNALLGGPRRTPSD